uniref:Uncharacterized protein n=1 Tax=Siphoviridae sp. ctTrD1 TaxID=2825524 RepID=A0A8S5PR45_9CAUD|nr:MAG TPA: hypothetical protein [Siphoviridae sp. ctTrD1]
MNGVVNVTCFDVCSFGFGIITTLPVFIVIPPKAEFCTPAHSGTILPERRRMNGR